MTTKNHSKGHPVRASRFRNPDYSLKGEDCILLPQHVGLVNGQMSVIGWTDDVAMLRGAFAPPRYSESFQLNVRFNGCRVRSQRYLWKPDELTRSGRKGTLGIVTRLIPYKGERGYILRIELTNRSRKAQSASVQLEATGGLFSAVHWGFSTPRNAPPAHAEFHKGVFSLNASDSRLVVATVPPCICSEPVCAGLLDMPRVELAGHGKEVLTVALALADGESSERLVREILSDADIAVHASHTHWRRRVEQLYERMPAFSCSEKSWERLYDRSLLHLLLNEWNVPEFFLHPYYSTGSIGGGCIGGYLWNYGSPYHLWSMLNPESAREHIRAYLSVDLGTYFAIHPDDGAPFGAYYPINQEKIIFLIHAYVLNTRDVAFFHEEVNGKTVIDHVISQALYLDDLSRPAVVVDYGDGNHHLELQRQYRYDGKVPDLNLRRCVCMRLADECCRMAGKIPPVNLNTRAQALKALVHETLFERSAGWFRNIDCQGQPHLRYTMQLFKTLGWGDWTHTPETEAALVTHLMNSEEFLGPLGVHSLSKQDPAYDEFDIDNGGPGACPSFPAIIAERLYMDGYSREGEAILTRLKWLTHSMPYWGDSQRADIPGYCTPTSLQCDIEGATPAQTFIFGMFGIHVQPDFSIHITPCLPQDANNMALTNIRLAGRCFSIRCSRTGGSVVRCQNRIYRCQPGGTLILPAVPTKQP